MPLSKDPILRRIDLVCDDFSKREHLLADLVDDTQNLVDIFINHGVCPEGREAGHLRRHWFNEPQRWWSRFQPIEPILRAGLIQAIRVAREQNLPMDCYWVYGCGHFEVSISWSARQVTVILQSPTPESEDPEFADFRPSTEDEPIWVVKRVDASAPSSEVVFSIEPSTKIIAQRGSKKRQEPKPGS